MNLLKLIDESVEQFGEGGHIIFHPHLWHTAMQDLEFVSKLVRVPPSEAELGQVGEVNGIKIFVRVDTRAPSMFEDRILKALVALQHPELLEFT